MNQSFLLGSKCDAQRTAESFKPITVDQILQDIKQGRYRKEVERVRYYRNKGDIHGAHAEEENLPIVFPGANLADFEHKDDIQLNGIAVVLMKLDSPLYAEDVLTHLRAWEFVKGYFTNVHGDLIVFIWVGNEFNKPKEFRALRDNAVENMNFALRHAHFMCRARSVRGLMAAYDPNCYYRPDSELKPFNLYHFTFEQL